MAYDKEQIYQDSRSSIEINNLFFIDDVVAFLPCSRSTFYEYFPNGSKESESLKQLLTKNKVQTKTEIRQKLLKSNKSSELLAVYKMIASDEERKVLSSTYAETHNTSVTGVLKMTDEEKERRIEELKKKLLD